MVGREAEREQLAGILADVQSGRGHTVLVSGEAGAGKSHLLEGALAATSLPVVRSVCPARMAVPYGLWAPIYHACCRIRPCPAEWASVFDAHFGAAAARSPGASADAEPGRLAAALLALFEAALGSEPFALLLDDVHEADGASFDVWRALAGPLRDAPVLVAAAYRSARLGRRHPLRLLRHDLRKGGRFTELRLEPLSGDAAQRLFEAELGRSADPALLEAIPAHTGGLPLFIVEIARALRAQAVDGSGGAIPLPDSVRDAIAMQTAGLPDAVLEALETLSVLGCAADPVLLAALGVSAEGLDGALDSGLLAEGPGGRAAFRHELVRGAIYADIPASRRRQLHARVAEALSQHGSGPGAVAAHWQAARHFDRARRAYLDHAQACAALSAHADAAAAYRQALALWDGPGGRVEVQAALAQALSDAGHLEEAVDAWRDVLGAGTPLDAARRGAVFRALAQCQQLAGRLTESVATRDAALEAFAEAGQPGDAAIEALAAAETCCALLQITRTIQLTERAQAQARAADRIDLESRALGLKGYAQAMAGRIDAGRAAADQGLALALDHGLTEAAAEGYRRLAGVLEYSSHFRDARAAYTTALSYCRSQGAEHHAQLCMGCMGYVLFRFGEWGRSLELCRENLRNPGAPVQTHVSAHGVMAFIHLLRGEWKPGRTHYRTAERLSPRDEPSVLNVFGPWARGLLAEGTGDADAAASCYGELLAAWGQTEDRHDAVPGLMHAAHFFAVEGLERELHRCIEALGRTAADTANPEAAAAHAYALAEAAAAEGRQADARRAFTQAREGFERIDLPYEHALAAYRAGAADAQWGDGDAAAALLHRAEATARQLGARPLAARVAAATSRAGLAGADTGERLSGLTRRQQDVAHLLAQGLTNKEIAARLFLSTRTVDMHVRHILARLDCRTRAEAAHHLSRPAESA